MPYRLLALDLDGTVLDHDIIVPPAVKTAVQAAQQRGVHVTIATGRTFRTTLPYAKELGIHDAIICYQGGLIRHATTEEVLYRAVMDAELAAEAVRHLQQRHVCTVAMLDDISYISEDRPELEHYRQFHPEGVMFVTVADLVAQVTSQPPGKLLFIAEPGVIEQELAALSAKFAGRLTTLRSHAYFGELMPLGVSKGAALEQLAKQLQIPREEVIAIGDQENDISMIAWAGLGLAIGNAIPEVKAIAQAVIPPVSEAGVAWAIEHYLLNDKHPTT